MPHRMLNELITPLLIYLDNGNQEVIMVDLIIEMENIYLKLTYKHSAF